jgi:hypothetical protein
MKELNENWLEKVNEEFSKIDIPHKRRPWLAWGEWAKYTGVSIALNDDVVKKIFTWFERNTKAGSQYMDPMYTGTFYYDSCFWPVFVPVVYGNVKIDAKASLKTIPESIKVRLWGNPLEVINYVSLWTNCVDYAFGLDDLKNVSTLGKFIKELLQSGDQQLKATITLLLEKRPNPKAMESARMATEMFLKAFLAGKVGLTEEYAKKRINHDLNKALNECLAIDPNSELQNIKCDLNIFPDVGDRYKGNDIPLRDLWGAYKVAQFSGAIISRCFSGRDIRKTIKTI